MTATTPPTTAHAPDAPEDATDPATRLRAAVARLSRRMRATHAGDGITPTSTSVLFTIVRRGPLGLSQLAEIEALNPTMLSRVVAKLADAGLVRRLPDPTDGRAGLVEATAAGRRLRERINAERAGALGAQLDQLSAQERATLLAALPVLERLAEQLQLQDRGRV